MMKILTKEKNAAIRIQCAYRCYCAKCEVLSRKSVRNINILKYSSHVDRFTPARILDELFETMWLAEYNTADSVDIRFELPKQHCISEVLIQTSTFTASPKYVEIFTVLDKKSRKFVQVLPKTLLPLKKGRRWHRLIFPRYYVSKYFKLSFTENYGDPKYVTLVTRMKYFALTHSLQLTNIIIVYLDQLTDVTTQVHCYQKC
jgi:hypothetical protein